MVLENGTLVAGGAILRRISFSEIVVSIANAIKSIYNIAEVSNMKSVIVRLDDKLFQEFDRFCKERGYAKQGLLKRLVRELVFNARVKSLPIEEPLPDEVRALKRGQKEIHEDDLLEWERIKSAL